MCSDYRSQLDVVFSLLVGVERRSGDLGQEIVARRKGPIERR